MKNWNIQINLHKSNVQSKGGMKHSQITEK